MIVSLFPSGMGKECEPCKYRLRGKRPNCVECLSSDDDEDKDDEDES